MRKWIVEYWHETIGGSRFPAYIGLMLFFYPPILIVVAIIGWTGEDPDMAKSALALLASWLIATRLPPWRRNSPRAFSVRDFSIAWIAGLVLISRVHW